MSKWLEAAEQFEERRESKDYFEIQSALRAIDKIHTLLGNDARQLIFLIGEPGSGKTFLLNLLYEQMADQRHVVLIETPFITPLTLLYQLIRHKGIEPQGDNMEVLRQQAIELYASSDHVIMIDEAQLLSTEMREFVRILADSKAFWFVLAMHRNEGEAILRAPHFKSRPHKVIELFPMSLIEGKNYLHRELLRIGFSEIIDEISPKMLKHAHQITEGNFRNFKKLFHHLFHLLHYTNVHQKSKYLRPSQCTITMAAIHAELLND